MKFVHAADIHLDSPLRGLDRAADAPAEEIRAASRRAFGALIDLCVDKAVAFLILAGDVFDGDWPDMKTGLFLRNQLSRLDRAGIPVFIVKGNHDTESLVTANLPLPDNVHVFGAEAAETVVLADGGPPVALHGQSFAARDEQRNLASAYPGAMPGHFNIGILHTSLAGYAEHETYAPCSLDDLLAREYDYWALGHVHRFTRVRETPAVVFPGNLQGRHVREEGAKGCVVVDVEDGRIARLAHHALDVLRWAVLTVDAGAHASIGSLTEATRLALSEAYRAADGRPLVARIILEGATDLHETLLLHRDEIGDSLRAAAFDVAADQVWIEALQIATSPTARGSEDDVGSGELDTLLATLGAVVGDPGERARIVEDALGSLRGKLPDSLARDSAIAEFEDPDRAAAMLRDLEIMLGAALRGERSEP